MQKTNKIAQAAQKQGNVASNKVTEHSQGNVPEKKFRAGAISATVWRNVGTNANGQDVEFRTISLERAYTDKQGNWHSTTSMRVNDVPKANLVLSKAYEYLNFKEQDLFAQSA